MPDTLYKLTWTAGHWQKFELIKQFVIVVFLIAVIDSCLHVMMWTSYLRLLLLNCLQFAVKSDAPDAILDG